MECILIKKTLKMGHLSHNDIHEIYVPQRLASYCVYRIELPGWNQVSIADSDDPLTQIVIRIRPSSDPEVTLMVVFAETYILSTTMISSLL